MTPRLHLILFAITTVYFIALAVFSIFWLTAADIAAFDGRLFGYGFESTQTYLRALSPHQVALYTVPFRIADTVFPALVALTLLRWFRFQTVGTLRLVLTVLTALYLAADYTENMLVGRMLNLGADGITDLGVTIASGFTQVKWLALDLCLLAVAWTWFKSRKGNAR